MSADLFLYIVLSLIVVAGFIFSVEWVVRDAIARGHNGTLMALLVVFVGWPFSLLLWIWIRGDLVDAPTNPSVPGEDSSELDSDHGPEDSSR